MIIQADEIKELEQIIWSGGQGARMAERSKASRYLCTHPHLLLACGFDQCRIFTSDEPFAGAELESLFPKDKKPFFFGYEAFFKQRNTGKWFLLWFFAEDNDLILFGENQQVYKIKYREFAEKLLGSIGKPSEEPSSILLPHLWIPTPATTQDILLADVNVELLKALHKEKVDLAEIGWRKLEEIVAELLKSKGLQVALTKMTRDGGRDIVAEGELIPGLRCAMAVEVKHKKVVGADDLAKLLYRNSHYPLLMLATSGRFSSGVLAEKAQEVNHLRLLLEDGKAIREWIDEYARQQNWNG